MQVGRAAIRIQSIMKTSGILLSMLVLFPRAPGVQGTELTLEDVAKIKMA